MTYLGLDLGTKTLGISKSNGVIASFYKTIRHEEDYEYLLKEVALIEKKKKIDKIVLGYPKNMNNSISNMAAIVLGFKAKLEEELSIEVILEDERLTSEEAEERLRFRKVNFRKNKGLVDMESACVILEQYLGK